jgi:hypothetical protein
VSGEGGKLSDETQGLAGPAEPSANLPKVEPRMPSTYAPLSEAGERKAPHILAIHAARTAKDAAKGDARLYAVLIAKQAKAFRAAADELDLDVLRQVLELDSRDAPKVSA